MKFYITFFKIIVFLLIFFFITFLFNFLLKNDSSSFSYKDPFSILHLRNVKINKIKYNNNKLIPFYIKREYKKLIKIKKNSDNTFTTRFLLAMSYFHLNKFNHSSKIFKELIEEKNNIREWLLYHFALSLHFDKKSIQSLDFLRRFRSMYIDSPFLVKIINIESKILLTNKLYDKLILNYSEYLEKVSIYTKISNDKKVKIKAILYYFLAKSYELKGNYNRAIQIYLKLIGYYNLFFTEKAVKALFQYDKKFEEKLNAEKRIFFAEYLYQKTSNYEKAIDLLNSVQYIEFDKLKFLKLKILIKCYNKIKKYYKILELYQKIFKIFNKNSLYYRRFKCDYVNFLATRNRKKAKILLKIVLKFSKHEFLIQNLIDFKKLLWNENELLKLYFLKCIELKKYRLIDEFIFNWINNKKYLHTINFLKNLLKKIDNSYITPKFNYWIGKSFEELKKEYKAYNFYKKGFLSYKKTYYEYLCWMKFKQLGKKLANKNVNISFIKELNNIKKYDENRLKLFIQSRDFQNRLSKIKLNHNFNKIKNPLFLQSLQLMSMGEIYGGYNVFLRYLNNIEKNGESRYHYFLIFSKFFRKLKLYQLSIRYSDFLMNYLNGKKGNNYLLPILDKISYPIFFNDIIIKLANKYEIDPYLIFAVIREESRFFSEAISRSGAMGLMQLMPKTAIYLFKKIKKIRSNNINFKQVDFYNKKLNINLGTKYISQLLSKMSVKLALASYNGGPTRLNRLYRKAKEKLNFIGEDHFIELIDINETRRYVKKVLLSYYNYKLIYN